MDVSVDSLRFHREITHGHVSKDERTLLLRSRKNELFTVDVERGAVKLTVALSERWTFVGFVGERALVYGKEEEEQSSQPSLVLGSGAWLVSLGDERREPSRVCGELPWCASIAPDHRSATLLVASRDWLVIDRDGAIVRRRRDERITARSTVSALDRDRAVIAFEDGVVEARDLRSGWSAELSLDGRRIGAAVDEEHFLYVDEAEPVSLQQLSLECSLRQWSDGSLVERVWARRTVTDDGVSLPMVATREGSEFSLTGPVRSLVNPSRDGRDGPRGNATLAFSERWMVLRSGPGRDGPGVTIARREALESRQAQRWPQQLSLSPDGTWLLDADHDTALLWDTRTGTIVDEIDALLDPAPAWILGGTAFVVTSERLGLSTERAKVIQVTADGLREWASISADSNTQWEIVDCSPDGQRALVRCFADGRSAQLFEWPLDESTHQYSSSRGAPVEPPQGRAMLARYAATGALDVVVDGRWWRRDARGWTEVDRVAGAALCFAGPGVAVVDRESDEGVIYTDDGRVLFCDRAFERWARDAFVRVFAASNELVVTDDEARLEWSIALDSDWVTDQFAISADGRTIAVLDGPSIKVFRRERE